MVRRHSVPQRLPAGIASLRGGSGFDGPPHTPACVSFPHGPDVRARACDFVLVLRRHHRSALVRVRGGFGLLVALADRSAFAVGQRGRGWTLSSAPVPDSGAVWGGPAYHGSHAAAACDSMPV